MTMMIKKLLLLILLLSCISQAQVLGVLRSIPFQMGTPGGSALSTGAMGYYTIPFGCTIQGSGNVPAWSIQVDAGTATVKFWKIAAGTEIPTSSNSISTSGLSISTGTVKQSTTVSDFTTTTINAGDIIAVDLSAVSGAAYIAVQITCW